MTAVLLFGDCLEQMQNLPNQSVDLVVADLPYGMTDCKWDSVIPLQPLWKEYWRICRGAVVLTASQPFTSALVMSQPSKFRHGWIWEKDAGSNFATVKYGPMREHEDVLVFGSGPIPYHPIKQERTGHRKGRETTSADSGKRKIVLGTKPSGIKLHVPELRHPRSIQRFNRERGFHPTQKPVPLMEYLIATYSDPGDVVLDNTMGSGTTGVASRNLGRNFIGIEVDEEYFAVAQKRILG